MNLFQCIGPALSRNKQIRKSRLSSHVGKAGVFRHFSRKQEILRKTVAIILLFNFYSANVLCAQQIITDGNTRTRLDINNNVTDITTSTVRGSNAFNSFSKFDVYDGNVVNLHLPNGTSNLLNLVHDYTTTIDGVLNSVKNGRLGGNVFFANPHGIVVGAGGTINVGSLTAVTPTKNFMNSFFDSPGNPSLTATNQLLGGTMPVNEDALISISGTVHAVGDIRLNAGNVINAGEIASSALFSGDAVDFSDVVNINGLETGGVISVENGDIEILAENDVINTGTLASNGSDNLDAGDIDIHAGNDIVLSGNSLVSARGSGGNSAGGDITVFADNNAELADNAVIDASGGDISGDGGFIEFSAEKEIDLNGGSIRAGSANGAGGNVLIDPALLNINTDQTPNDGQNRTYQADQTINVGPNVTISSRQIAGTDHLNNASTGNSGSLVFKAPEINLFAGSKVLAHADNGWTSGTVTLDAQDIDFTGTSRNAYAQISLTNARITGGDIKISAFADTSLLAAFINAGNTPTTQEAQDKITEDIFDTAAGLFLTIDSAAAAGVTISSSSVIQASGLVDIDAEANARFGYVKDAEATVTVTGSAIRGNSIDINARADTSLIYDIGGRIDDFADDTGLPSLQPINDEIFDYTNDGIYADSDSNADILINGGSLLETQGGGVTLNAFSRSRVNQMQQGYLLGFAWGDSEANATVAVEGAGTLINSDGDVILKAETENLLDTVAASNAANKPVDITFVRADAVTNTDAHIGAGAAVDTRGNLDVLAKASHEINASSMATEVGASSLGAAVTVSTLQATTNASIAGTAEANDITVKAENDTEEIANAFGASLGSTSSYTDKFTNFQASLGQKTTNFIMGKHTTGATLINTFAFPGKKSGNLNLGGAVTYVDSTKTTDAYIANGAAVTAHGDLTVRALSTDDINISAAAKSKSDQTAIGGAVALGYYTNNLHAHINDAVVDAEKKITVEAENRVPYPWAIDWTSGEDVLEHLKGNFTDMLFTSFVKSASKGHDLAFAGALSLLDLQNNAVANIGEGAAINTNPLITNASDQQDILVRAHNEVNVVTAGGTMPAGSSMLDRLLKAGLDGKYTDSKSANGLGGTFSFINADTGTTAYIADNAVVNAENNVEVKAETDEKYISVVIAGMSADKVGIAGAVSAPDIKSTTLAFIDDKADVTAGNDVKITADGETDSLNISGGVVFGANMGVGASVSLTTIDTQVRAFTGNASPLFDAIAGNAQPLFDDEAQPAQDAWPADTLPSTGSVSANNTVEIKATSNSIIDSYSLAATKLTSTNPDTDTTGAKESPKDKGKYGFGISGDVSINEIEADTLAHITDGATVQGTNSIDVIAENTSDINSIAGSVTLATGQNSSGIAGSYAQNTITGETRAFINNSAVSVNTAGVPGDLYLAAKTTGEILAITASGTGAGKVGIAGSVSNNKIINTTQSYISNDSDISSLNNAALTSVDDSSILSVAGSVSYGGKAGIGASVSLNTVDKKTDSYIENSDIDAVGNVSVTAISGKTGDVYSHSSDTQHDDSNPTEILSVSAAIGASQGQMAAAGAVSINTVSNETHAYMTGRKSNGITAGGDIEAAATDDSDILSVAGSLAGSGGGAGVGVSFAWNEIDNDTGAYMGSGINAQSAAGDIRVSAEEAASIFSIAAAGGAADKLGLAGAAVINTITNTTSAYIGDGTATSVSADGNVIISADDDTDILSIAGSFGGGGTAGLGASNSTIITDNTVSASIGSGTAVTASGNQAVDAVYTGTKDSSGVRETEDINGLSVTATSYEDITSAAAGAAGGGSFGIAGSASVIIMDEKTSASIDDGATINADNSAGFDDQDVNILASDRTRTLGIGGAVAGGGTGGVGVGADVGIITKDTQAHVWGADVKANRDIKVRAESEEDITSISASAAGGGTLAVAGSAGVYVMDNRTRAFIGDDPADAVTLSGDTDVHAEGSVVVSAADDTEIDIIAGNISGAGTASIGASAAVPVINKTTEAFIGSTGRVTGEGKKRALDVNTGTFTINYIADSGDEGEVSSAGAHNKDLTDDGGNDVSSPSLTQDRNAAPDVQQIKGVAVTAINQDNIETIGASGGGAGAVAVNISGGVSLINSRTTAHIDSGARVNENSANAGQDQSVVVAAGNDLYHMGISAAVSGAGAAGVAPGADITVIRNTTKSYIDDSTLVEAKKDILVTARSKEDILSVAAGAGVGGTVGVGGAVSVISLDNVTEAYIGDNAADDAEGAKADADGNILVAASDDTETMMIAGSLGIGFGAAGVGGSVGITDITKKTSASIGSHAAVNARGKSGPLSGIYDGGIAETAPPFTTETSFKGLAVQASSKEDVFTVGASAAGGWFAGLAGGVTVGMIDSDTTARIGDYADINKGITDADNNQSVNVSAVNDTSMFSFAGGLGVGIAGIGGGVDVGIIRNDTSAGIGDYAEVSANSDIDVNALSNKSAESYAVSGAVGIVGVAGSVSVVSIGDSYDSDYSSDGKTERSVDSSKLTDTSGHADDQPSEFTSMLGYSGDDLDEDVGDAEKQKFNTRLTGAKTDINGTPTGRVTGATSSSGAAAQSGTSAIIGQGALVSTGDDVNVRAKERIELQGLTGSGSGGIVGIGGSVTIAKVRSRTDASIASGAEVNAGADNDDDILVEANLVDDVSGEAYAGQAGLVALGAQVVVLKDSSSQYAHIDDSATIDQAGGTVSVTANADRTVSSSAFGGNIGGVAAGVSLSDVTVEGDTMAFIGSNVQIGQDSAKAVNNLDIGALSAVNADAETIAVSAGIFSGSGSVASTDVSPVVSALIGDNALITASNRIFRMQTVNQTEIDELNSGTIPLSLMGSFGAEGIELSSGAVVSTEIDDTRWLITDQGKEYFVETANGGLTVFRSGGNIDVTASADITGSADASGVNAGGVAVGVSDAESTASPWTTSTAGNSAILSADGDVTVQAKTLTDVNADSIASGGGLIGVAGADSESSASPYTASSLGDNAVVTAQGDVTLEARSTNNVDSDASGIILGVAAFGSDTAASRTASQTTTSLGKNASVDASNMTVGAYATNDTYAKSTAGAGGGIAGVTAKAVTTQANTTTAAVADSDPDNSETIKAQQDISVAAEETSRFNSHVDSTAAGLVGISGATISNTITSTVDSSVGRNTALRAGGDIGITALNRTIKANIGNNLNAGAGGIVGGSAGTSTTSVTNTTSSTIRGNDQDDGPVIESDGDVTVSAENEIPVFSDRGKLSTGGAIGLADVHFKVYNANTARAEIGGRAILRSGSDINVHSRTAADIRAGTYTRTWGIAGVGNGTVIVDVRADNDTLIGDDADLYSRNDINVYAGLDEDAYENYLVSNADARSYVSGLVPISSVTGRAYLRDYNDITIGSGSSLRAERDVNLGALTGVPLSLGYAKAKKRSYALFGIPITVYSNGNRTSFFESSNSVTVDGTVESGLQHKKVLTIPADGNNVMIKDQISGNIQYSAEEGIDMQDYLQGKIDDLNARISDADIDPYEQFALILQRDRYQDQLNNSLPGMTFDRITVDDTRVGSGDINITGSLSGTGLLKAPGKEFIIEVTNHSTAHLDFHDLEIPADVSGNITLNRRNLSEGLYHGITVDLGDQAAREINIFNTYIPDDPGDPVSDIILYGDVTNVGGSVTVRNRSGSTETYGDITADVINIDTAGNFTHNWTPGTYQTNTPWDEPLIAGRNIYISAEIIDINGTVQSGIANRYIVIPEDFDPADPTWLKRYVGIDNVIDPSRVLSDDWTLAIWDAENQRIQLDPVRITGGNIELYGKITSTTGYGELKVIDGYGDISVTNSSPFDIELSRLDAGGRMSGSIRLIDVEKERSTAEPLVTEFSRDNYGFIHEATNYLYVVKNNGTYDLMSTPVVDVPGLAPSRNTTYLPVNVDFTNVFPVAITFDGSDIPGNITVLNEGGSDIFIKSAIRNVEGNVFIENQGGNILTQNESSLVNASNIFLAAPHGNIGVLEQPLNIDIEGGLLAAKAEGLIHLNETIGDVTVGMVATNGNVKILADGSIIDLTSAERDLLSDSQKAWLADIQWILDQKKTAYDESLRNDNGTPDDMSDDYFNAGYDPNWQYDPGDASIIGEHISLTAGLSGSGGIGSSSNEFTVDSAGVLNAEASGDIYLTETQGNAQVRKIRSANGDVVLIARNGDIVDFNFIEAADQEALDALLNAEGQVETTDEDTAAEMQKLRADMQSDIDTDKQDFIEQKTDEYRSDHVIPDEEIDALKDSQKKTYDNQYLDDNGTPDDPSDDFFREGHDPNWEYTLTDQDIYDREDRVKDQKFAEYQDLHRLDDNNTPDDPGDDTYDSTYDPNWEYTVQTSDIFDATYDSTYVYTLTPEEENRFSSGSWESTDELVNAKNIDTVPDGGKANPLIEDPNIEGRSITLVSGTGNIGRKRDSVTIYKDHELTPEERIVIANADKNDISDYGDRIVVSQSEDFNVHASGTVTTRADNIYLEFSSDDSIHLDIQGTQGGLADSVDIYGTARNAVIFDTLQSRYAKVNVPVNTIKMSRNIIGERADINNRLYYVIVDNLNKNLQTSNVQLYAPLFPFVLHFSGEKKIETSAYVVNYDPDFTVNFFSTENSITRLDPKMLYLTDFSNTFFEASSFIASVSNISESLISDMEDVVNFDLNDLGIEEHESMEDASEVEITE